MTLEELEKNDDVTVTVPVAAKIMGVSPQFLRMALSEGRFPFGVGVKMDQNESYINKRRFIKYMKAEDM